VAPGVGKTNLELRRELKSAVIQTALNPTRCSAVFTVRLTDLPYRMAALSLSLLLFLPRTSAVTLAPAANPSAIPLDQIGATVEKEYKGEGLSVRATPGGARLRCVFQRMECEATREGLWLTSTADESRSERLRVVATAVRRVAIEDGGACGIHSSGCITSCTLKQGQPTAPAALHSAVKAGEAPLSSLGTVKVVGNIACFLRPGIVEEYRVSVDGVQQDFIIAERPEGEGQIFVELDVAGAKAQPLSNSARLLLEGSGRKLNYDRLRVTDAAGRELAARMEVLSADRLAVLVEDADAVYPVRIDPTFSDADWFSLGGIRGANGPVFVTTVDGSDNLYIGGDFTTAGGISANYIARWNGSAWSGLGSGMNNEVRALAVSGSDLYAGGSFTTAGGVSAANIAKWNGSAWSALGLGMRGSFLPTFVYALAVSGSDLFAGGAFDTAGAVSATNIAKWNGSVWSALDLGMNDWVYALAVSGSDLYAGGFFTTAGGISANYIARWNGSAWSALGSGMDSRVYALAASGSDLYAGGLFTTAGGKVSAYAARANIGVFLPRLSILRFGTNITVVWPSDSVGFRLEQKSVLANPSSWTTNAANVTDDATNKSVTLSATNGQQFFRLTKP
jgi:hypothetical protein